MKYFSFEFSLFKLINLLGKGTQKWKATGKVYDGDWKKGKRSGFGTLTQSDGKGGYNKEYSGGWKNDKKHV